jgi:hypothetical protein
MMKKKPLSFKDILPGVLLIAFSNRGLKFATAKKIAPFLKDTLEYIWQTEKKEPKSTANMQQSIVKEHM